MWKKEGENTAPRLLKNLQYLFVCWVYLCLQEEAKILILSLTEKMKERGQGQRTCPLEARTGCRDYLSPSYPHAFFSFLCQVVEWKCALWFSEDGIEAALSQRKMTLFVQTQFPCLRVAPPTLPCSRRVIPVNNIILTVCGQRCNILSSKQ